MIRRLVMANQDVQTKVVTCAVKKTAPSVTARATVSDPETGAWSMFLNGAFIKGGNAPADVDLGSGTAVIGKMLEVSAMIKNIAGTPKSLSLRVDVDAALEPMTGDIDPGHAASYSMFVVFEEEV
jgi:hypothetical protein